MEISRIFLIGGTSSILLFSLLFSISSSEAHQSFHSEDIISLQPHTIQRSLLQADLNDDETIGKYIINFTKSYYVFLKFHGEKKIYL